MLKYTFRITVLLIVTSFLTVNCQKKKNDNSGSNALLFFLLMNQGSINFSLGNPAVNPGFQPQVRSNYIAPTGDGTADGFADVLLSPTAIGLMICDIVGFKPPSAGGPASGQETVANGTSLSGFYFPASGDKCTTSVYVGVKIDNPRKTVYANLSGAGSTYDRIGIVLRSITLFFPESSIPDPNRRYWDMIYSNILFDQNISPFDQRGNVQNFQIGNTCPKEILTNGGLVNPNEPNLVGCYYYHRSIDVSNGQQGSGGGDQLMNPSLYSGLVQDQNQMMFQRPADMSRYSSTQAYVVVLPVTAGSVTNSNLFVDIFKDNVLFYDSTDGDKIYDPVNSAGDRPNATDASVNLTDSSFRNLIMFPPAFKVR